MSHIVDSIKEIKKSLKDNVKLLAVSKYHTDVETLEAYHSGCHHFGESRVQDLQKKSEFFLAQGIDDVCWHFIGNLQSNKINNLFKVKNLFAIHSVDSIELLKAMIARASKLDHDVFIFLEVNTSGEAEKGGFRNVEDVFAAVKILNDANCHLKFFGLMTMGPIRTDDFEGDTKKCFKDLRDLRDRIDGPCELSMGMSSDYLWAQEYGATWVRVGSKIFN